MSEARIIKKYANRRLYDATQSRHITVEDIRRLIVAGERIKVVKDKTGEDITRMVLLQIIAEQEQFGRPILSLPLLEALIREAAARDDTVSIAADDLEVGTVLR
jgi:polyhydroxyalkanoate synthesis repressor PhaR